jgi:PAS domain S-box-containing protein
MDTKPLPADSRLISLFEIFAARAAAEQRRLRKDLEVRAREEELSALFDSAMDAVVVLDAAGVLTRVNPAAERLFGSPARALIGEDLRAFLPPESASLFDAFVRALDAQSGDRRQLWIPQSFPVLRQDRTSFPAEATLSRFTNRDQVFHTVILRNVDDRLAAERTIALLTDEAEYLRASVRDLAGMGDMLGGSPSMKELFEALKRVAATDATVLVFGETGTGKELIAHLIHQSGARKDRPLVRVNCAAIPGALMESEFFGHERGAFTAAPTRREGRIAL